MTLLEQMRSGLARAALSAAGSGGQGGGDDPPDRDWMIYSDDDVSDGAMIKALTNRGFPQPTEDKPRAMFHDPYSVMDWGGWRQRPSALTYETLRQMSVSNTCIAAIILLRTEQVSAFCKPQQGQYDRGYRVILRDRRDKKRGMTSGQQKEAERIERFLETTGLLLPDEKPSDRDSFRTFCKKATRDTLTYDQWCFEKIRDRAGRPSRFNALPSETIRPAVADIEHMDPAELRSRVSHVQVYENQVISEFSPDDLAWCIKNPRSDLRVNGFGFSPIEQVIRLTTAWLFGFEYNTKFFTQGSAIKGLINIKGAIPDRQLRAFRRMWYSMVSGVQNAWKTPIVNADELQWISMHSTNREMEYGSWMDWLTKLICAIYGVDPIEINFIYGASGGSSLFDRRPNQAEVTESKDKGLRPLLSHIEDHLNTHILWEINPDFEFSFTGFDAKAEDKENERRAKQVTTHKTVNEIRAEENEEPLPGNQGDVILNQTWLQWAQGGEEDGEEGPEEGGGGDFSFGDEDDLDFGGDEDDEGAGGPQTGAAAAPEESAREEAQEASESGGEARKALRSPLQKAMPSRLQYIDVYLPEA